MSDRWSNSSIALHWLSVLFIVGLATVGFFMTDLPTDSGQRLLFSRLHTLGGATLMVLTIVRLVARRRGPVLSPLPVSTLHQRGINLIHGLLYATTFGLGASGFLTGALSEWPAYLQGQLAEVPALKELLTREIHEALVFTLIGLTLLHVGGVLLQQLRHGGVLNRMIPFLKPSSRDHQA